MSILMDSNQFINKAKNIANNYKTVYGKGTFGQPVTNGFINGKLSQYPDWYKPRESFFRSLVGKNYFAFDCVGLVKGILWGWSGNPNATHGGATYLANGVPDVTESGMLSLCSNVTTNFSNPPIGAFLWVDGHCGIYIGNKQAIECTPKWQNKVQITSVANMGNTSGNYRTWTKWGKLPWVNYVSAQDDIDAITKVPPYVYKNVDYAPVFDPTYYVNKYADLKKEYGTDAVLLFKHFLRYGMKERRQASAEFNVDVYKSNYADLQKAYGDNYPDYYKHYCLYGKKEGRVADKNIVNGTFQPVKPDIDLSPQRDLKRGSTGEDVKQLQRDLASLGYSCGAVDGSFGPATQNAVKTFQKTFGLSVDGVVGPKTRAKIAELLKIQEEEKKEKEVIKSYKVRVTATALYIRTGPGKNYTAVSIIRDKGVYEIVETKNNWGRLGNGKGWICLDYAQKI